MANIFDQFDEPPPANPFDQFDVDGPGPLEDDKPDSELEETAPGVWQRLGAGVGVGATITSAALAEPVGGLAGIGAAVLPGEEGAGARTAEAVGAAMTYEPEGLAGEYLEGIGTFLQPVGEAMDALETGLGEATLEATGSPMLATMAHTAPTALLEVLGLGLLRKPSQAARAAAKAQERVRVEPNLTPEQRAIAVIEPEERTYEQITKDLGARQKEPVAKDVRPDPEIQAAAEELGVDLNPGHYSTSEAFIRVEQALKSQPRSLLAAKEAEAITKVGERADELILEFGGDLDKSLLDTKVRTRLQESIDGLEKQSDRAFAAVNKAIPAATKVRARASRAYLAQRLEDMGGDVTGLSPAEKALHGVLSQDRPPTYARMDELRKDVGEGFKRLGSFKDDASGNLKQVYGVLQQDQQGIADAYKVGKTYAAARKMVQTRKDLEANSMKVFGRDLNKSLVPQMLQASTALTKGDVAKLKNLMNALPADARQGAAATMLNDLFTSGTRKKGSIGQGFASAYQALNRNAGAKRELFKYLPEEAQRRFDSIGIVSEGIYRAKALENTSKTARDILESLENGSMVANVADKVSDTVLGRMTFVPGPTRWLAAGAKVSKDATKEAFNKQKAADKLLASREFNTALQKAAEGQVKEAEVMLKRSKAWQAWRGMLGEGTKKQLAAMGPIAWLTQQEAEPVGQ